MDVQPSPEASPKEKTPEPEPEPEQEQEVEQEKAEDDDDDIIMEEPPERHFDVFTVEDSESDEEMDEAGPEERKARRSVSSVSEDVVETRVVFRNVVEPEPDARMEK